MNTSAHTQDASADHLAAYCEFLWNELRAVNREMGHNTSAGVFSPCGTIAKDLHFPFGRPLDSLPQPSTRAAAVLRAVGILAAEEGEQTVYSIDLENSLHDARMRAGILCEIIDSMYEGAVAMQKSFGVDADWDGLKKANYLAYATLAATESAAALYRSEMAA